MGADSWSVCPRCMAVAKARHEETQRKAAAAYGKVSVEEFDRLRAEAAKPLDIDGVTSLAEYHEQGMLEDGTYFVEYDAECGTCKFHHKFSHKEKVSFARGEPIL